VKNPFGALFDRKSIGSSYDLWTYLNRGTSSSAGVAVSESTALSVMAVLTCVSLRSRALASLPIKVYERLDDRNKRLANATLPGVARVLSQPNTWQTRSELFGMLEAHRVLRGNAYAWKNVVPVVVNGQTYPDVIELIPMHPDKVEVLDGAELGGPGGYRYHTRKGRVIEMRPDEVVHLRGLSTDGLMGRSVLQDMREAIGGAIATQDHANSLWSRDATPSVVLKHKNTLSEKARKNLEHTWEETYGRTSEKKRVAVIEEGMEIERLSLSPEDGQFLETRKFSRSEIAGAFHVPPHMIGDTEKSTSWGTGIEQQQIGFVVFTMMPDLSLWEQRLTRELIRAPERFFIEFSVQGMLRGDQAARGQFYRVMREVGAYSANDIRAFENMNPVDGGDDYLRPTNLQPLALVPGSGSGSNAN